MAPNARGSVWHCPGNSFCYHYIIPISASHTYMHHWTRPSLVQIILCCLFTAKPLSEPMLVNCQMRHQGEISVHFIQINPVHFGKWFWKCHVQNGGHFVSASICYSARPHKIPWQIIWPFKCRKNCKIISGILKNVFNSNDSFRKHAYSMPYSFSLDTSLDILYELW